MRLVVLSWITLGGTSICAAQVLSEKLMGRNEGNLFPELNAEDHFGASITTIEDLDLDGVPEIIVGAPNDDNDQGLNDAGAFWILFPDSLGNIKRSRKITDNQVIFNNVLLEEEHFGSSVAGIEDGPYHLIAGSIGAGDNPGKLWLMALDSLGSVTDYRVVVNRDRATDTQFGWSVLSLGDINRDGSMDFAVGEPWDSSEGFIRGAVWIASLGADGGISWKKITGMDFSDIEGEPFSDRDEFGWSLTMLSDLNEDDRLELVAVSRGNGGKIWILSLDDSLSVTDVRVIKGHQVRGISEASPLSRLIQINSVQRLDLEGDGVDELAVSYKLDREESMRVIRVPAEAIEEFRCSQQRDQRCGPIIPSGELGDFDSGDVFGSDLTVGPDFDGNGLMDLIVGASHKDIPNMGSLGGALGSQRGGIVIASLNRTGGVDQPTRLIDEVNGGFIGSLNIFDSFGLASTTTGDLDGNGVNDIAVSSMDIEAFGSDDFRGSVRLIFLDDELDALRHIRLPDQIRALDGLVGDEDRFGYALAFIPLDQDNVHAPGGILAVGAPRDDSGGDDQGAVWLFSVSGDQVRDIQLVGKMNGQHPALSNFLSDDDEFGSSLAYLGRRSDRAVLAVGAPAGLQNDALPGQGTGTLYLLSLDLDDLSDIVVENTVTNESLYGERSPGDRFAAALTFWGDSSDDGLYDVIVTELGATNRSAGVHVIALDAEFKPRLERVREIRYTADLFANATTDDRFGRAAANVGDLNRDGVDEIAIGASLYDGSELDNVGIIWLLFLNEQGDLNPAVETNVFGIGIDELLRLDKDDFFGTSVSAYQKHDSTEQRLMIVGATGEDAFEGINFENTKTGGIWFLQLNVAPTFDVVRSTGCDSGEGITISVNSVASGNLGVDLEILFRKGGDPFFLIENRTDVSSKKADLCFPDELVTDLGLEYSVTAIDDFNFEFNEIGSLPLPIANVVNERLQPSIEENGSEEAAYRLVSAPMWLTENSPDSVLTDDLGDYDDTEWRFFEPVPGERAQNYPEFPDTDPFTPGKAFWLVIKDRDRQIDTGAGVTVDLHRHFLYRLQEGWNAIGNPYTFDIPLENIRLSNGDPLHIYYYDNGWQEHNGDIVPFEGYMVWSETDINGLIFDPDLTPDNELNTTVSTSAPLDWSIRIQGRTKHASDATTRVGVSERARNDHDPLDKPEPPGIGNYISVYVPHDDWNSASKRFDRDIRSNLDRGQIWRFESYTNERRVDLDFFGMNTLPDQYRIVLEDLDSRVVVDLADQSRFSYVNTRPDAPKVFRLIVGLPDFVEAAIQNQTLIPKEFALMPGYPNPFVDTITLPYQLPVDTHVEIEVYNVLGQKVATVVQQEQRAGYHRVAWDGVSNACRCNAASGVYFVTMRAEAYSQTEKVVYVR